MDTSKNSVSTVAADNLGRVLSVLNLEPLRDHVQGTLALMEADLTNVSTESMAIAITAVLMHKSGLSAAVVVKVVQMLASGFHGTDVHLIDGVVVAIPTATGMQFFRTSDLAPMESPASLPGLIVTNFSVGAVASLINRLLIPKVSEVANADSVPSVQ